MSLLVVGSVALDTIITPFGEAPDALGGSAVHFSVAASLLSPVRVVGVIGDDFPTHELEALAHRGIDWSGVEKVPGESFRWKGRYSHDLQQRESLETNLGVFGSFRPKLPAPWRESKYLFLGNIDPVLQMQVLDQMDRPELVACDTMNFWIEGRREELLDLLKRVDVLIVNDGEARQLSGEWNIHKAARWILAHGPDKVVIKQGEYGAMMIDAKRTFYVPAYPLESVFDPTGAGDSFAGGFMGFLARAKSTAPEQMRRAMVYGAAMGSFAVEGFGITGFDKVDFEKMQERVRSFVDLTHVPFAELLP